MAGSDSIRKAAVLGAGIMGARIAAHIANAGFPVLLMDLPTSGDGGRNRLAERALAELARSKPPAFTDPRFLSRIAIGNFEDDLQKLGECDWVVEAVAENLSIKRELLQRVAPHCKPDAMVSTNTSGLPVHKIAEGMPPAFRSRWMGTHFFNPPRYMRLMELIVTPDTDPAAAEAIAAFARVHLGKTVVRAKDTPNFIANRIGTFAMLNSFQAMEQMGLTIEQVDALTGSAIGWPKTGTFRLADMVGIDVLASVARNFQTNVKDERSDVTLPPAIEQMVERKWLGDKTGQGFYKKTRGADGKEVRLVLDLKTMEYRPAERPKFAALEMAKSNDSLPARLRALMAGDPQRDPAAQFYWKILPELWDYAAHRIGEVADSIVEIDRAMRTGFNWELGPFAMWDAAGVAAVETHRSGRAVPPALAALLQTEEKSWYRNDGAEYFDPSSKTYKPVEEPAGTLTVAQAQRANGVVAKNPGASLIDLGEGVGCIEFHSKMNTIGTDIVRFIVQCLDPNDATARDFRAFVIANDAANFSVGANLMQVLLAIQDEEWDEIGRSVRAFQAMTQAIKFSPRPVVAAPFGMCLGGGTEISLHAAARQPHIELYMGLVESSVGLLPAGGGCKEMLLHAIDDASEVRPDLRAESVEIYETLKNTFETIAMAKVSSSAVEAQRLRFLREGDGISMHRDRVVADARAEAIRLANAGYAAPERRMAIPAPGTNVLATLRLAVYTMREAEFISDHDALIGRRIAHVLCGGDVPPGTPLSEQYLLDLEREAFLSLCGERKTQERIAATLKTGKPLRN